MLHRAERALRDAAAQNISNESRFDAAYLCILQVALIAMLANGYRPARSQPGHHQALVQALPRTLGLESGTVIVLDALRKKRNVADYEGDPVSDTELAECRAQAETLLPRVQAWLQLQRPDLLE